MGVHSNMYLVIDIVPALATNEEPVLKLRPRVSMKHGVQWDSVAKLLKEQGLELGDQLSTHDPKEWPWTAIVFTSKSKFGVGRSGSSIYRWAVRIEPEIAKQLEQMHTNIDEMLAGAKQMNTATLELIHLMQTETERLKKLREKL